MKISKMNIFLLILTYYTYIACMLAVTIAAVTEVI